MGGHTDELSSAILQIKQELFILQAQEEGELYLSLEEDRKEFHEIIASYRHETDIFSCLSDYVSSFEDRKPSQHLLVAMLAEASYDIIVALQNYLLLAANTIPIQLPV